MTPAEPTDADLVALWQRATGLDGLQPHRDVLPLLRMARDWRPAENPEAYGDMTAAQVAAHQAWVREQERTQ